MNTNFSPRKLKSLIPAFFLLVSFTISFNSCIISKNKRSVSKTSEINDSNIQYQPAKSMDKTTTDQPDYNLKPPFSILSVDYNSFLKFFGMGNFYKFKVIPYQRNQGDIVRLYCYALSADYDVNKIGEAFYVSSDGTGEIPRTLYHPIIYDDLGLSKAEMKQILTAEPVSVIYLTLVPMKAVENGKSYNTYRVFKNGHDTKVQFRLSPKNFN